MRKNKEREEAIEKNMRLLDLTREEAEELYDFDHEKIDNEEVIKIEQKVEGNKETVKRSSIEKVKYMKAKKKSDACKEGVIDTVFNDIRARENLVLAQQIGTNTMVFMDELGGYYTVKITKNKKCPDGYSGIEKEKTNTEESAAE